jgi:8-oxo-dGTP pyrophosphatase MutT (NUDIX family)
MAEMQVFGARAPDVEYKERRAAYVVLIDDGRVALVKGRQQHFLPGGGSLPGETPEATVAREVSEELASGVRLLCKLGEAVQYFYSATDDCHYQMLATFFAGELTGPRGATGEHELRWLPIGEAPQACFHECHAWAISCATGQHV